VSKKRFSGSVKVKHATDIGWQWIGPPEYSCAPWAGMVQLDPTPGYAHDMRLVREWVRNVQLAWPAEGPVTYHVASLEGIDRANGQTIGQWGKGGLLVAHHVFLAGKRIPPHPSVTAYLVAHEYGHCVEDWIWMRAGVEEDVLREEYRVLRGLPRSARKQAAAGTWHSSVGEIIACDFRVLVAKVQVDYWPHPGIKRPEECPKVVAWWARKRKEASK
jgi:hypothetical protein